MVVADAIGLPLEIYLDSLSESNDKRKDTNLAVYSGSI